ncbi:hypothetical protein K3725_09680 [Leisingera sp. S132]|uniref:hypothetical protein n=1 Tax=Leisingera sp. S132 TaxID=2867016 RepID=UPI0021A2D237|nr:hypothetical protein [Leisingera sp. S132]UWQ77593.1 hypothetical protein K3725_09680 [Leisingera sp. S132]
MATLFPAKHDKQPHCRYCGAKLRKWIEWVEFGPKAEDQPRTKEEANRRTNRKIVHYTWGGPEGDRRIVRVSTWDGERYQGGYFCKIQCAVDFAFLFAEQGRETVTHQKAIAYQRENP